MKLIRVIQLDWKRKLSSLIRDITVFSRYIALPIGCKLLPRFLQCLIVNASTHGPILIHRDDRVLVYTVSKLRAISSIALIPK